MLWKTLPCSSWGSLSREMLGGLVGAKNKQ